MSNKPSSRPHFFPIGTEIWFNAYIDPQAKTLLFLCRGIIARQPTETSKIYKVIPIEVFSIEKPSNPKEDRLIRSLLGKKIPKHGSGITKSPAGWYLSQQKYSVNLSPEAKIELIKEYTAKNEKTST